MEPILIKNGVLLDCFGLRKGTLLVAEGRIADGSDKTGIVIDATRKLVLPGFANCHTHVAMSVFRNYADDMLLQEWLTRKIWPLEAKLTPEVVEYASLLSCIEMLRCGTTLFNDMYFHCEAIANAVRKTGIRAVIGYGMADFFDEDKMIKELKTAERYARMFSEEGNISFAVCPHAIYTCSGELIKKAYEFAKEQKLIFHMHVSETRREVFECIEKHSKRPFEYLSGLGVLKKGVFAHASWVSLKEIDLLKTSEANVVHCPVSNMKLASGELSPVVDMLEKGVNVGFGTDGPASNNTLNILETAKFGAILQKNQRWNPRVMDARSVFAMLTSSGYSILGLKGGTLEKGMLADIVLVDLQRPELIPFANPYSMIVYSNVSPCVDGVIVNGKLLMEDKRFLIFDEQDFLEASNNVLEGFLHECQEAKQEK